MSGASTGEMTKPKLRPCPVCQVPNQVRAATCSACASSLRPKLRSIQASLKSGWAQNVLKNKNADKVLNSAMKAVSKLNSLGFQPILFTSQTTKAGKYKWDLLHFIQPKRSNVEIIQEMHKLYKCLIQENSPPPPCTNPQTSSSSSSSVPAPTPQCLFTPPVALPSASSYYIIPAPPPPGTSLTPYYVLPAVNSAGPIPVPAPRSYQFVPAPQTSANPAVPGATPYYLLPLPPPPSATFGPAAALPVSVSPESVSPEPTAAAPGTSAPTTSAYVSPGQQKSSTQTQAAEISPVKAEGHSLSIHDFFTLH